MSVLPAALTFLVGMLILGGLLFVAIGIWAWIHSDRRLFLNFVPWRFRLRTLLLAFSIVQVFLAVGTWRFQAGEAYIDTFAILAVGTFVAWTIWCCLADTWRPTASRKWKRVTRPDHITLPD